MTKKSPSGPRLLFMLAAVLLAAACASPLRRAIDRGDAPAVSALLDRGADKKESLPPGVTLLKAAVRANQPDVVQLLLARGADINERRDGTSALGEAATAGNLALVKLLLAAGAVTARSDTFWVRGPNADAVVALLKSAWESQHAAAMAHAQTAAHEEAVALVKAAGLTVPEEPAAPRGAHDADFALVVGVGKYLDAPEARFAEADAEAVGRRLIALGWPARNVLTLTGDRAGRAGLDRYLDRWLPANAGAKSRFFFYFAGDGAVDPKTGSDYLLPWDADAGMLEQTGYPLELLRRRLGALGGVGAAAVIDAGFSGSGERAAAAPGRAAASSPAADADARGDVILASAPDETVGVLETSGRGLFTDALLAALDSAPPGPVDLRALFPEVRDQVSARARQQGRRQTPRLLGGAPQGPGLLLR